MASLLQETSQKVLTPEILRSAAKQSQGCLVVPVRLRRAIKKYLRDQEVSHLKRKVLRLSQSFSGIKDVNLQLAATTSKELVEDPLKSVEQSKRWKIKSVYGDIGFQYTDDETIAYVASRMPAVFSACYRVLNEVRRRLPDFSPTSVLDFGAGTGSGFWALREVWPHSIQKVNIVEPSQSMQRAGQSLIQGLKNLPLIHGYDSIQSLNKDISKSEREHDLVIASYVLGEIPSLQDRVTIVRQLWNLTKDVLVLVEPGTPQGSNIISQMRSHILWMEKRKWKKNENKKNIASKDLVTQTCGAYVVAPCPHDGKCPLEKSGKYCHFVQRLERTTTQRIYKVLQFSCVQSLCCVCDWRGQRPREPWPLDGMRFETLKEQHAKRNPEDLEIDYEDLLKLENQVQVVPYQEVDPVSYDSDVMETEVLDDGEEEEGEEQGEPALADLGGGWGRIVFSPRRRGNHITMNICRSTKRDASEGSFDQVVVTQSQNPTLHHQARKSIWGDLWPF